MRFFVALSYILINIISHAQGLDGATLAREMINAQDCIRSSFDGASFGSEAQMPVSFVYAPQACSSLRNESLVDCLRANAWHFGIDANDLLAIDASSIDDHAWEKIFNDYIGNDLVIELMRDNLREPVVVIIGDQNTSRTSFPILIIGLAADGTVVGISSTLIWT